MKFLPNPSYSSFTDIYSGYGRVEQYIENTRSELEVKLPKIFKKEKMNLTSSELAALLKLKGLRSAVTIKPADKNLGIVVLNTVDYIIEQCIHILLDENIYRRVAKYPSEQIKERIKEVLFKFSTSIKR